MKNKDNFINKKKFCEFYEVFIIILFDKYKNKLIGKVLDDIIKMNILYLKNIKNENNNENKNNCNFIDKQFYDNIFYLLNNQIFLDINKSVTNNNAIFELLENIKTYDNFYITYINHNLFNIEKNNEKLIQLIGRIENSYKKRIIEIQS